MIRIDELPPVLRKADVEEDLARVCELHDVVFLAIFGSFVRGEQKKRSDIDIAVEFDRSKPKTLFDLVRLQYDLTKVFKRKVDVGIFSSISPHIVEDVKKEIRVIYEKR